MVEGGGEALVVAPFYERDFYHGGPFAVDDVNSFGVSFGVSIFSDRCGPHGECSNTRQPDLKGVPTGLRPSPSAR